MMNVNKILKMEKELIDKLWYARHMDLKEEINNHEVLLVEKWEDQYNFQDFCSRDVWNKALKCASGIKKKYGKKNLEIHDDIELGILMGKLSAIRWFLYGEWDDLDT